jgi:hypothetical protein
MIVKIAHVLGYVLLALAALAAAIALSMMVPMPSAGGATEKAPTPATGKPKPKCKTVTAKVYNKRIRLLRSVTDTKRGSLTHKKQCKSRYKKLGVIVRKARADCKKNIKTSGASYYDYGDSGGIIGSCGRNITTIGYSFAILGTGDVASHCWQAFYFERNGNVIRAIQGDTGGGGGSAGGYPRTFDFYGGAATALGLRSAGLGAVNYSPHNCWAKV